MSDSTHLAPPRPGYINPDHVIPLSPPIRPPFSHYHSSTTLPATPHTPYPSQRPSSPACNRTESTTRLKPFLGLTPRLLLTTLTPALLPLILTIAHLIQTRSSTSSLAASLRSSVLSACSGLATGAASLQSLPRYLAMQTNDEVVRATQASILAIGGALVDCVTIIEKVVEFIVDTYRSLLLCTIELVVRGTLEVVIQAVKVISDGITASLNTIRTNIQSDLSSANNLIQSAVSKVNSVTSRFNINVSLPEITIPSLTSLENVTIPTSFEDSLVRLNTTLPTLADLKQRMNSILETPFELLKTQINSTRLEMAASFNSSILPVPKLTTLAADNKAAMQKELCDGLDTSLIDDTAKALHKLSNVAIGLMFLLLVLVWAGLCWWEWRRWRAMKDTVELVEDEWRRDGRADAWKAVAIAEHPIMERYGGPVLRRIAPKERTRTNLKWYCSYLAHPTCLALLFISLLGLLSLQFQLVALGHIKSHAQSNANATVTSSTQSLSAKLNSLAADQSKEYADEFNLAIAGYQKRIDDELFGSWVNTTAVVLNQTLVEFYDGVEDVLNKTFGNTILYNPIQTFTYCILGSKIANLELALTWIQTHAHITLPTLPADILLLSPAAMNEMVSPISAAAVGSSADGDKNGGVVGGLIEHFESAIRAERTFYAILLGVWLALAILGLIAVIWHSGGGDRYAAYRSRNGGGGGGDDLRTTAPSSFWKWGGTPPIYAQHQHGASEKQFRGTSPVPKIVEPRTAESFFNINRQSIPLSERGDTSGSRRPFVPRKGTFGSTLSTLAAPGQAFLRMTGRTPSTMNEIGAERLVEKGGSSERYNNANVNEHENMTDEKNWDRAREGADREGMETPPPFWVNRFYGAVGGLKGLFPTRGQRHGAALARGASQKSTGSFGASQANTPRNWRGDAPGSGGGGGGGGDSQWTMIDTSTVGRALDRGIDGRYPTMLNRSNLATSVPLYPRPMSRAPTLHPGEVVPPRNPFDNPPPVPTKMNSQWQGGAEDDGKHDSIDYLVDERRYPGEGEDPASPASSSMSYFPGEVHVESANRVETGTAALAAILANMQERKGAHGGGGMGEGPRGPGAGAGTADDPFRTVFDDEYAVKRGGRI